MSVRKLKKVKDDIVRDLRPDTSTMDWRQVSHADLSHRSQSVLTLALDSISNNVCIGSYCLSKATKAGRRIIKSEVDNFKNLRSVEKQRKAEELMGTDLADKASREDRTQILRQVGKVTVDTLKKVGLKKLKGLSVDYVSVSPT